MLFMYYIKIISFYHFNEHIMYNVYYIFICHISFYCIYKHYVSQRQTTFQFNM